MEASNGTSNNTLLMMFGVPIVTTAVVCSSMYVGHLLTKRAYQRSAQATAASASAPRPLVAVPAPTQPVTASAPVARAQVIVTEEKIEPRAVIAPVASPASEVPAAAPAKIHPNISAPESATAPAVPVPALPAPRKPSVLKPPAIPTPLLVPGKEKDAPKSSRVQRDTKPYPQRVVPETRTGAKPAPSPAPVATTSTPAVAAPSPLPPAPAVVSEPAPSKAAIVLELDEPAQTPVFVAPKRETKGDVAVGESVRGAPVVAPAPVAPAPVAPPPAQPAPLDSRPVAALSAEPAPSKEGRMILASSPVHTPAVAPVHKGLLLGRPVREEDLCIDLLYALSKKYVDAYCIKQGKNPAEEQQRWTKRWMENVEQALMDGDSSEQQFINRVTIAKRDCFNIEKAPPEKIVEGCRILLRYREGNFAWLSAMREALTRENLLKTLNFLNAGPQS